MRFNENLTEEDYNNHLLWLEDNVTGIRLNKFYTSLSELDLSNARLIKAKFRYTNLNNVKLKQAILWDVDFSHANLSNIDLEGADLTGSLFYNTTFSDCNLRNAILNNTNLYNADLEGIDLKGCRIIECIGNGREIKNLHLHKYLITYTKYDLAIGCQQYPLEVWRNKKRVISKLLDHLVESSDIDFLNIHYDLLMTLIDTFPAL